MESEIKSFSDEIDVWKHVGKNIIEDSLKEFFEFDAKIPPHYRIAVLRYMVSCFVNGVIENNHYKTGC